MAKKSSTIPALPACCHWCDMSVMVGERKHLQKVEGKYVWICHDCYTPPPLSKSWVRQFGDTRLNGFPVDKDKKTTSLERAVGFRRFRVNENGVREVYHVKRKTSVPE